MEGERWRKTERKVITVAVPTVTDALKHSTIGNGNGVGLRAGILQSTVDANGNQATVLTAYVKDVAVSGTSSGGLTDLLSLTSQ